MDKEQELGSIEESIMRKAVYRLFSDCPFIPEFVKTTYGDMENDSIGMFSQQGSGRYIRNYISGSYEASFPFFLRYRSKPTTDEKRIAAEDLLSAVAQWMCGKLVRYNGVSYQMKDFPVLTDNRRIESMESGNVFMADRMKDGTIDYQVQMSLSYFKKGS